MSETTIIFDSAAYDRLADDLRKGRSESPEWFDLRMQAEQIALSPGFEQLLSLDSNNIDEYPHQIETALIALRKMRGRALLADEVGLGKTIEAGIIMKELILRGLVRRALILVPASLTNQWREEMSSKFNEEFVVCTSVDDWDDHDLVIASIDLAKRPQHAKEIVQQSYDLLIVDEAHRLRNRRSLAWRFVDSIKTKYVLFLTATPVHNDLSDLYSLVTLIRPGALKTYRAFRQRYVKPGEPLKPVNAAELKALLSDVMIRNRRSSVSVKFPARTAYTYKVKFSQTEWKLYSAVSEFIRSEKPTATDLLTLSVLQRQVCSSAPAARSTLEKLALSPGIPSAKADSYNELADLARAVEDCSKAEAVCKIVREAGDKVIVFTEFIASQKLVVEALRARGVSAVEFHGGLTPAQKNGVIESFRDDAQVLVSTESGGEGRNLQFCNVMVNYDLPWNPMLIEQRIGRIHRLGQTRDVFVFNLSSQNTIEAYILDLLANKIRMFELVVGELDLILGDLESGETFEGALRRIWIESMTDVEIKQQLDALGKQIDDARSRFSRIKEAELIVSKFFD